MEGMSTYPGMGNIKRTNLCEGELAAAFLKHLDTELVIAVRYLCLFWSLGKNSPI